MAESRRQLIEGSSFLRNEKEKIGGLNVKRSTITGDAFKKGTSQESAEKIDKRVGNNERKITLLKNIIKTRKQNVNKKLGEGGLQSILLSIAESVDSIRDTLIQRQESGEEGAAGRRIKAEQDEFDEREKKLEKPKDRFGALKGVGNRVLKPVMSLWERIWNFIKTIFLGKILLNFLSWITNPANQKKIGSFIRFVKDWWPALLGAVLLFGTGFGAMITNLTVAVSLWIPKMLAAIKALGVIALAGGGRALSFGRKAISAFGKTRRFDEGGLVEQVEPVETEMAQGTDTVPAMLTPGEFVMSRGAVEEWGLDTMAAMNAAAGGTNQPKAMGGTTYASGGGQVIQLNAKEKKAIKSGRLPSPIVKPGTIKSYEDAMAAGIVIEDAVAGNMRFGKMSWTEKLPKKGWFGKQKYKRRRHSWNNSVTGKDDDNILGMSTQDYVNRRMGWTAASSKDAGGVVPPVKSEKKPQGLMRAFPDNVDSTTIPDLPGEIPQTPQKQKLPTSSSPSPEGTPSIDTPSTDTPRTVTGANLGASSTIINRPPPKGRGWGYSLADFMTLGLWDFDHKNPVNRWDRAEKDTPQDRWKRHLGGFADFWTGGLTDFDKRGAGAFQFNPIGGGAEKSWGPQGINMGEFGGDTPFGKVDNAKSAAQSISKPSTGNTPQGEAVEVVKAAQNQQSQQSTPSAVDGGGDELPDFDAAAIRDVSKIKTLGMMVL